MPMAEEFGQRAKRVKERLFILLCLMTETKRMISMNWEKIKSWLLTALVLLSIIFFWNLVVFQENYEAIPKQEYIHEVSIAEKRKLGELIIPDKMVYRISGDYFVGTEIIE